METAAEYLCRILPEKAAELLCSYPDAEELRLRARQRASVTRGGVNVICDTVITDAELKDILVTLCNGSLHAHEHTLRHGYLTAEYGIRVGVAGRVNMTDSGCSVPHAESLCIRIPHTVRNVCHPLVARLEQARFRCGMLVCGLPGCGKTTLLRDLICTLASPPYRLRVTAVDSRGELRDPDPSRCGIADYLVGYPKSDGIEIATRVLNPQIMVCDEIGSSDDTDAILAAQNSGVPLVASAHAADIPSLLRRPQFLRLMQAGIFPIALTVERCGGTFHFSDYHFQDTGGIAV